MSEKDRPKQDNSKQVFPKGDNYFEKGLQGMTPPKPNVPSPRPDDGSLSDGVPGWTPPKNDE